MRWLESDGSDGGCSRHLLPSKQLDNVHRPNWMAIGWGEDSEMQVPLPRAIIGGLLTSTRVPLLLVPCVYSLLEAQGVTRRGKVVVPAATSS